MRKRTVLQMPGAPAPVAVAPATQPTPEPSPAIQIFLNKKEAVSVVIGFLSGLLDPPVLPEGQTVFFQVNTTLDRVKVQQTAATAPAPAKV